MTKNRTNNNFIGKMTMSKDDVDDDAGGDNDDDMGLVLPSRDDGKKEQETAEAMRQLRDENGRLFKLLAEKDFETKQLRKKLEAEKEKNADLGISQDSKILGGDVVATKIVDLSRKNRELSCDVESEKNKSRQLSVKLREAENEVRRLKEGGESPKKSVLKLDENPEDVIRSLQDKLSTSSTRLLESKAQLEEKKQMASKMQRALEKELGTETVNLQAILVGNSNWQGRAQKIINLQNKVAELNMRVQRYEGQFGSYASVDQKNSRQCLPHAPSHPPLPAGANSGGGGGGVVRPEELDYDMEEDYDDGFPSLPSTAMSSASTVYRRDASHAGATNNNNHNAPLPPPPPAGAAFGLQPLPPPSIASARAINENKQYAMIKKLERERKEAVERMGEELKASEGEKEDLNKKMESMKARIRVLTIDMKAAKTQVSTLLDKGKHDDELVQALMGQLNSMKDIVDEKKKDNDVKEGLLDKERRGMEEKLATQEKEIAEMEIVVADKERRIAKLQDQIIDMQKNAMTNPNHTASSSPRGNLSTTTTTADRLGSLFYSDPDAVSPVTLPSIYPSGAPTVGSGNAAATTTSSAAARRPSRIPSTTRRRSAEGRSRCKSRVDRPLSSNAAQEKTAEEMKVEIQELRYLGRAAEVERDRLMQLLSVNEDRNTQETHEKVTLITKLQDAQRKIAKLEKEVERHQIKFNRDSTFIHGVSSDAVSTSKSAGVVAAGSRKATSSYASTVKRGVKSDAAPAMTRKPASLSDGVEDAAAATSRGAWGDGAAECAAGSGDGDKDVEYLEMRVSGLLDENATLQKTLEATLVAKKQDLALLQEMMTQTKSIFLKAMKELKGG